jgi:hypothetical protein
MTRGPHRVLASLLAIGVMTAVLLVSLGIGSAWAVKSNETSSQPVIVMRSWKTTPPTLSVGGRFRLELILDNVVDVDAVNTIVTVGAATITTSTTGPSNAPEIVALGSNTRYVGTLPGKTTGKSFAFDLVSNPKSVPGPFSLPVTIEWDGYGGIRNSVSRSIGLMLNRTLIFDVGALTYPKEATATVPFDVAVTVQNTNEFPVNGVALAFSSAEASWTSAETTVGVLEPGKSATLKATGVPMRAGVLPVAMIITYKDDYNQIKQIRRDFTITVQPAPEPEATETVRPQRTAGEAVALFFRSLLGLGG